MDKWAWQSQNGGLGLIEEDIDNNLKRVYISHYLQNENPQIGWALK